MRRVRLLLWKLYYGTPLKVPIAEWVERGVARQCKLTWAGYCELKERYPELWERWANKRAEAQRVGRLPLQPWQLRRYRKIFAPIKATHRKARPRFIQWAGKKLIRARRYKRPGLRRRVVNRLFLRFIGL